MSNSISLVISLLALVLSSLTFWLTRLRSGEVKMTRPTLIFMGPDGNGKGDNKIYLKTLLYSTSDRGKYVQNMFVRLHRGESIQNFNVWVYGNTGLERGSGLYIDKSGIACNHHFLLPKDGAVYEFLSGDYLMQVYVETVDKSPKLIFEQKLAITPNQQSELLDKNAGIFFDWAPNTQNYSSHIDPRPVKNKDVSI